LEKSGMGPELFNDFRRERMRSYLAMLKWPKAGEDVVWDAAGTGSGDIPASSPRGLQGKKGFNRAVFLIINPRPEQVQDVLSPPPENIISPGRLLSE
jgi:hypothetical protein